MSTDNVKCTAEELDDVLDSLVWSKAEKRAYKKMRKRHHKELRKLAKDDRPWDWEYIHDLVVLKVKQVYEYYMAGNCVTQAKEEREKLLKSMKKVMDILDVIEHVNDPYTAYNEKHPRPFPNFVPNGDGSYSIKFDEPDEIHEERHKIWGECRENYGKLFEKFYAKLGKEMRNWWD